jgi:hypothetical protein
MPPMLAPRPEAASGGRSHSGEWWRCVYCEQKITGRATEHCTGVDPESGERCCLTFASTTAGDSHRTGDFAVSTGPERRRCRTTAEMREGGMWQVWNRYGTPVWHGQWSKAGRQRRHLGFVPAGSVGERSSTSGSTATPGTG